MTSAPQSPSEQRLVREVDALPELRGREGGVTLRVVVLCLTLAALFGYALPVIDYKIYNTFLGGSHLPAGAIGVLLLLLLVVNPLLKLARAKWALSRNEALTVYISCLFSSLVPGHGSENFLIPNLIAPFYYATRENKWLEFLSPYVMPWMMPAVNADGTVNRAVVDGWYQGIPAGASVPWGAWLVPLGFWIGFVLISYAMFGCLSVILRAQWAEREALAFPLLKLPLTMTEDMDAPGKSGLVSGFFRNPMMWSGFGIAVFIQMMKGLHVYFPDFPDFPTSIPAGPLLSEAPWNQIGGMQDISVFPMVVGITYLLTSEISFSLWFFYLFLKFQNIVAYSAGYPRDTLPGADGFPDKIFTGNQVGGCYLAYVALILWTGREHFKHVALRAIGRAKAREGEATEMISYPLAFWGFIVSIALMIGATVASGVRADIAIALWFSYLVLAIGLSRVAVEGGMLALQHHTNPLGAIARLLGSGPSGWMTLDNGVTSAAFFQQGMVNHMRGFIMPSFIHSFKLAHDHKISRKPLGALIVTTILIAVVVSWITTVNLGYNAEGALSFGHKWWSQQGGQNSVNFIKLMNGSNRGSAPVAWFWLSFGGALTWGMMLMRSRFAWFPLHPIGYIMSLSYSSATFWFSIFLGWMCKGLISKFGGGDAYRKTIPLFLGLALGDVFMIFFWLVIDGWQGRVGHLLLPG